MTRTILVTGAGGAATSNFIDALRLSKNNYKIIGVEPNKYMRELSKADETHWIPYHDEDDYIEQLNYLIDKYNVDFIHAQPDPEVLKLSENVSELNCKSFLPGALNIKNCQDKMKTNEMLSKHNVPTPRTWDTTETHLPRILRLYDSLWLRLAKGANSKASLRVTSMKQYIGWIDYWEKRGYKESDFMLSEYLPGREYAWQSLWHEGNLVVSQSRERLEYFNAPYSPTGQTSSPSVARTINDLEIDNIASRAVKTMAFLPHGVYSVDLKRDHDDNIKVMEINPGRFFTTSNFFAHAGLNIPEIYTEIGLGEYEETPGRLDSLPENLYWLRGVDMGYKLVDGTKWKDDQ